MKLRLRSLESKETRRLEAPSRCTLQQLKQLLSQAISSSPSSLRFSLNRKDELHASSPETSLQSIGVTSGDLIYYSLNPTAFVAVQDSFGEGPQTLDPNQNLSNIREPKAGEPGITRENENPQARLAKEEIPVQETLEMKVSGVISQEPISKDLEFSRENQEIQLLETPNLEGNREILENEEVSMDIDEGSVGKKISEPYFLRRVLREELDDDASAHKLVVIAVHAVFLESGFVGVDMKSGKRLDRFYLPDEWPSTTFTMSLWYTLPELLNNISNDVTESVVLKFQSLGHFVNVYGCLDKGDSLLHRVCLNEYKFAPIIDLVWTKNDDKNGLLDDKDESKNLCPENEVFEFWKIVKDGLALPLLIDLCDRTGLSLPACLMRLPTELKLKILESLPGVNIAILGCVCSEMRYLASNDDLWKKKFAEEFGGGSAADGVHNWKERFVLHLETNKRRKRAITQSYPAARPLYFPVIRRDPNPFGIPPMIGGDFDRLPGLGSTSPFGQPSQAFSLFRGRRHFSPNCNLGGI